MSSAAVKPKPLSAAMAIALAESIERGGVLVRHRRSFWTYPGCPRVSRGIPEWYVRSITVDALAARGELKFSEWRRGRGGPDPVRAMVRAAAEGAAA